MAELASWVRVSRTKEALRSAKNVPAELTTLYGEGERREGERKRGGGNKGKGDRVNKYCN